VPLLISFQASLPHSYPCLRKLLAPLVFTTRIGDVIIPHPSKEVRTSLRLRIGLWVSAPVFAGGFTMPEQRDKFGRYALVLLVVGALSRLLLITLLHPLSTVLMLVTIEDLRHDDLEYCDPDFEVSIGLRAIKPSGVPARW